VQFADAMPNTQKRKTRTKKRETELQDQINAQIDPAVARVGEIAAAVEEQVGDRLSTLRELITARPLAALAASFAAGFVIARIFGRS
jgi:hypothetical protein